MFKDANEILFSVWFGFIFSLDPTGSDSRKVDEVAIYGGPNRDVTIIPF